MTLTYLLLNDLCPDPSYYKVTLTVFITVNKPL